MKPGLYNMIRTTDQTGVSGTGRVAQMAIFEDGTATVRWMTGKDSTVNWAKWQDAVDVHINCHPDTTKLVPAGGDLCEHGINVYEDYCDPCAVAASKEPAPELTQSDEWAAARQAGKRLATAVYDWCAERQLRCQEHNSHGLYFDVWINGRLFMFDCSPEDEPSSYQKTDQGRVVVRDDTHHYSKPTRVAVVNFLTGKGLVELDNLLGTRPI